MTELKQFKMGSIKGSFEQIFTMIEVLDLLDERLREGLLLNIELKNCFFQMKEWKKKIVELICKRGLRENVVYSSFWVLSLEKIRSLQSDTEIRILDSKVSDGLYKLKGGCGANALHPYWRGMDIPAERLDGYVVRAWFSGHLYPEKTTGTLLDMGVLEKKGITYVFLNETERYLENG